MSKPDALSDISLEMISSIMGWSILRWSSACRHTELMLTQMSAKFQHVFQILSNTQGSLEAAMLQLHLQVDQALQGRIPSSLINTDTLRNTLKQIQSNCPTTLTLPMKVDHAKFLNWYYRHLPVLVIPGRSVFYLVTVFPLVQPSDSYQLYQAVTVPVSSNTSSLAATYKLESNTIGIAKDKAHYIYLTDAETMKCEADEVSYCRTQVPAMSIANAPSCAVALFQNNKRGVRKRCKTILKDDSRTPKVKHLFAGRWVVSANRPFKINVACYGSQTKETRKIQFEPPVQVIDLEAACVGLSPYFLLPPYYEGQSQVDVKTFFDRYVASSKALPNIWGYTPVNEPISIKMDLPAPLKDIEGMPIDHLKQLLDMDTRSQFEQIITHPNVSISTVVLVFGVIVTAIGAAFHIIKQRIKNSKWTVSDWLTHRCGATRARKAPGVDKEEQVEDPFLSIHLPEPAPKKGDQKQL